MAFRTYDRTVTLQRSTVGPDEYGDLAQTWATLATVPAKKLPGKGVERFSNAEVTATSSVTFRVPWSNAYADLNPKDRLISDGRTYDIQSADEVLRRVEIEIIAIAGTD